MENIMNIVINTVNNFPELEATEEFVAFNDKMQELKASLPSPVELDKVSDEKMNAQNEQVDPVIHGLTCDFLKQRIPIDEITNVMFYQLLKYCALSGFTEYEWKKMHYYVSDIIKSVRDYFKNVASMLAVH